MIQIYLAITHTYQPPIILATPYNSLKKQLDCQVSVCHQKKKGKKEPKNAIITSLKKRRKKPSHQAPILHSQTTSPISPSQQLLFLLLTLQPLTKLHILPRNPRIPRLRQLLSRRPNLPLALLLLRPMPHNSLSNTPLKKQRPLFHFGMHFTIDKNSRIEVFLREIAQVFVFGHDAFVDFADEREICRGRVFVAEDLVLHGGG